MEDEPGKIKTKMKERIDAIIKERPSHKEILGFLGEVLVEQFRIRARIRIDPVKIDKENIQATFDGFPLVAKRDLPLDIASATGLFKRLCKVMGRQKDASGDLKRITGALRRQNIDLEELLKQVAAENGEYVSALSKELGIREDLLLFLAGNSIRPVWEAYAEVLKGYIDQERWWRGYCPICGSLPFIAQLREEGERFLVCSSCSYEWRFKRLKCPFCENEDPKELRYFYSETEGKANRVDVCDKCKAYIKAIDLRERPSDFISIAEDAGTLYMDVLAQAEGYKKRNNVWGLEIAA